MPQDAVGYIFTAPKRYPPVSPARAAPTSASYIHGFLPDIIIDTESLHQNASPGRILLSTKNLSLKCNHRSVERVYRASFRYFLANARPRFGGGLQPQKSTIMGRLRTNFYVALWACVGSCGCATAGCGCGNGCCACCACCICCGCCSCWGGWGCWGC